LISLEDLGEPTLGAPQQTMFVSKKIAVLVVVGGLLCAGRNLDLRARMGQTAKYQPFLRILFPSASFVPGFEIYNVETKTDIYSGVRGEDTTDAITLVTGPHAEIRIPRKQIVSIKPSNVSLMPEGLDESVTRPEFIDLLAFLQSQKSREMAQVRNAETR